jgi:copper homeostasis protein
MRNQLEICCTSFASAQVAARGGADRIELCDNLYEAGTTPSFGLIEKIRDELSIAQYILIRPRGGDFVYSDDEFDLMKRDIAACKQLGVAGIVSGVLNPDYTIDVARTKILRELAHPLEFTFHRAFDLISHQLAGLNKLVEVGAHRILTSGGAPNVEDGKSQLELLVKEAGNRIKIVAGGGLRSTNASNIKGIGCREFHTTARILCNSKVTRPPIIALNGLPDIPETGYYETSLEELIALRKILDD